MWLLVGLAALLLGSGSRNSNDSSAEIRDLTPDEAAGLQACRNRQTAAQRQLNKARAQLAESNAQVTSEKELHSFVVGAFWFAGFVLALVTVVVGFKVGANVQVILSLIVAWVIGIALAQNLPAIAEQAHKRAVREQRERQAAVSQAERAVDECGAAVERVLVVCQAQIEARKQAAKEREQAAWEASVARANAASLARATALREQWEAEAAIAWRRRERSEVAPLIKAAFSHWTTVAKKQKRYLSLHAERLIAEEQRVIAAYQDCAIPGATMDDCLRLGAIALREFPAEIGYWLRDPRERTVEKIAYVFRRFNGDYREHLLPVAHKLKHERNQPATSRPSSPASTHTLTDNIKGRLKRLPPDVATVVAQRLSDAQTLSEIAQIKREALAEMRTELQAQGWEPERITEELNDFASNLDKIDRAWAKERGMLNHDARR